MFKVHIHLIFSKTATTDQGIYLDLNDITAQKGTSGDSNIHPTLVLFHPLLNSS